MLDADPNMADHALANTPPEGEPWSAAQSGSRRISPMATPRLSNRAGRAISSDCQPPGRIGKLRRPGCRWSAQEGARGCEGQLVLEHTLVAQGARSLHAHRQHGHPNRRRHTPSVRGRRRRRAARQGARSETRSFVSLFWHPDNDRCQGLGVTLARDGCARRAARPLASTHVKRSPAQTGIAECPSADGGRGSSAQQQWRRRVEEC